MRALLLAATIAIAALGSAAEVDAKPRTTMRAACRAACEATTAACVAASQRPSLPRSLRRCRRTAIRRCLRLGLQACPPAPPPQRPDEPACPASVPDMLGAWEGPTLACNVVCSNPGSSDGAFVEPCGPDVEPVQSIVVAWQDCEAFAANGGWGWLEVGSEPLRFTIAPLSVSGSTGHYGGTVVGEALAGVTLMRGTPLLVYACRTYVSIGPMTRVPSD